jgi:hypothetical protein
MQTIRVISNISYNTLEFFETKINELTARRIIDWAYWVYHFADEDELKDHIHFVLKPSKRLETADLRDFFKEIDPNHDKPRTCTARWQPTNSMDDWLLYAKHDPAYLTSKGQYRRHHYEWKDIKATDEDALKADIACIDMRKYYILEWLEDAARSQTPFFVLVQQGLIPIAQRSQFEFQYNALTKAIENEKQHKSGRKTSHEKPQLTPIDDDEPTPFD